MCCCSKQPVRGEKTSDPRTGCVGDYKHPRAFEDVFCYNKADALTSKVLDDIFYQLLSEEGTIKQEKEEQIIMHWRDYLADCEGT